MSENKQMKKLYDFNILQWGLTGINSSLYYMMGGNTILKENLGIETVVDSIDNYTIHASASKHIIDVHRCDGDYMGEQTEKIPLEEELFFKGGIAIYQDDELIRTGPIWFALKESPQYSLKDFIFGDTHSDKGKKEIIEMILNAYEYRDDAIEEIQHEKEMANFRSGRSSMLFDV